MTRENSALQCENLNARCANLEVSMNTTLFTSLIVTLLGAMTKL